MSILGTIDVQGKNASIVDNKMHENKEVTVSENSLRILPHRVNAEQ